MKLYYLRPSAALILGLCCMVSVLAHAATVESGLQLFEQPNAVTFYAWYQGHEFTWECETSEGYTIIHNAMDNFWYYAILGNDGDYALSSNKVGIDAPAAPLHLRRTEPALSLIEARIDSFNEACEEQRQQYENAHLVDFVALDLGMVLVEFPMVCIWGDLALPIPEPPYNYLDTLLYAGPCECKMVGNEPKYTTTQYLLALNSIGEYSSLLDSTIVSPDSEHVYGSFRDYWREVSRYNNMPSMRGVDISVQMLNTTNPQTLKPNWLAYPNTVNMLASYNNWLCLVSEENVLTWLSQAGILSWACGHLESLGLLPAGLDYIAIVGAGINWKQLSTGAWIKLAPVGGLGMSGFGYPGTTIEGAFSIHERWDWSADWQTNHNYVYRFTIRSLCL